MAAGVVWEQRGPASAAGAAGITAGGFHTCVLTSAGGVKCWGRNDFGQLGDGTTSNRSAPVDVVGFSEGVAAVTGGGSHTCILTLAGGVKCWGRNDFGQLGDGTTTGRLAPTDVLGLDSGVAAVSAGGFHTCAVTTAGAAKCWGRNDRGQLGDGTSTNRTKAVDVLSSASGTAGVAPGGSDTSGGHTCGRTDSGGGRCWGRNDFGQVGDGTTTGRLSPVDVVGLKSSVAGIVAGRYHSCALTTAGGVMCWGWNIGGQLGDGTNLTRLTPVDVMGLGGGVAALTAGGLHTCALTKERGVKCWGFNNSGQLGDGTSGNNRTAPVDVLESPSGPRLLGIGGIAAGGSTNTTGHTCALTTAGGAKCWGDNTYGQLGDGTTTNRSSPVDVFGLAPKPTPTSTATSTPTSTPTPTATDTATSTPSPTATDTATSTPTPTPTDTPTSTETPESSSLEEQLDDLRDAVDALDVPPGMRNSLKAKLDAALRLAERSRPCAAVRTLDAFIRELRALQRSHRISAAEASNLIARVQPIIDGLRAEGACPR